MYNNKLVIKHFNFSNFVNPQNPPIVMIAKNNTCKIIYDKKG